MLIKSVKISNFKSYKNECVLDDLSLGLNSFFGKNGAGKSNLIDAFHFLLRGNHDYKKDSKEGKSLHLVRYRGQDEISVEIALLLDNLDEVKLKKTWSARGYRYFVNGGVVSVKYFGNLLCSFGFPGSPEFFVVNSYLRRVLSQTSNHKRLNFIVSTLGSSVSKGLKAVTTAISGTEQSFSNIHNLSEGLKIVNDFFSFIGASKWAHYQKLLKKKEYLYLLIRFQTLKNIRSEKMSKFSPFLTPEERKLCCAKIIELENCLKDAENNIDIAETIIEDKETESLDVLPKLEKVRLEIDECVNNLKNIQHSIQTFDDDLTIASANLASIKCSFEQEKTKMSTLQTDLRRQESERQLIIEKFTLNENPELIAEWYDEKIKMTVKKLFDERQNGVRLQKMIDEEKEVLKKHQNDLSEMEAYCEEKESMVSTKRKLNYNLMKLQMELDESRKKECLLEAAVRKSEGELNDAKFHLIKTVGQSLFEGMLSVQKVLLHLKSKNEEIDGYYGLIVENFECNQGLYNAIDASAGKKVFYHLISRMEVGNLIMKNMKILRLPGEVTFIPLDKIKSNAKIDVLNNDARSLLSQLKYPEQFEKAMVYCFGHILLCRNLQIAVNMAKIHNCLATTMEGDVVRSGSITGGYIKSNRSVKFNYERYSQIIKTKESQMNDLAACKEKTSQILDETTKILSSIQRIDVEHSSAEDAMIENKIKMSKEQLLKLSNEKKDSEEEVAILVNNLNILQSQGSILDTHIESERLQVLSRTIINSKKQLDQQNLLTLSYEKKIDNIQSKIKEIKEAQKASLLKQKEKDFLQIKISDLKEQETLIFQRLKNVIFDMEKSKKDLKRYKQNVTTCMENIENIKQKIEKSDHTIKLIEAKLSDLNIEIKEITDVLISDSKWDKYKNLTLKELDEKLVRTSNKIKELGEVIFSVDIEEKKVKMFYELESEHKEVFELACEASVKLLEIKEWLEKHIIKTVEEISSLTNFYFNMFHPMEVRLELEKDEDSFVGIALKIVNEGLTLEIGSLSGSQQTALIVSMVFSIAQVVNFKIILLDEVDQFMDEESVTCLLNMISEMDMQIFAASHKRCFVSHSKNLFLIQNKSGVSYVEKIDVDSESIESTLDLLADHDMDAECDCEDPRSDPSFYSPPSSPTSF